VKVIFKASFLKSISGLKNNKLKSSIVATIENVENAESIRQILNIRKLKGYKYYYRIRIGNYRVGIKVENETIYFVDIDHRKDIYKHFP
jgi:mRNA interferase RelE/StbE